jgi:putative membrane protein insertion efficiency factor
VVRVAKTAITFLLFALLFLPATDASPDDSSNLLFIKESRKHQDPLEQPAKAPLDLSNQTDEVEMAGLALLRLYQIVFSSQDGPRCMFHPSCSEFAKIALSEHGAVVGSLMTIDRYLRCNGVDRQLYPYDPARQKLLDPVPQP